MAGRYTGIRRQRHGPPVGFFSLAFPAMAAEHSRFARVYPAVAARADRRGAAGHRRRLVEGLAGRVVEVGAGNGRNFAHYPAAVTEVVAIEPEPTLRALAASASHSVPVTVLDGVAEALPFADGELDAAVVSLVLCSVPDQGGRSRRSEGCSGRAASCASTST